ncbi:hypothetical protein GUJ93_ZPchr0011g28422 [Zizania palustris]|uniref:Uncharacterized protein n=1 Tax=Zizania palustris TaxID=103762 RepID=A0A8J5WMB3_ZIZPA|nr:hypothetical protein GUJ93_ZPchr0011g28422 [Zizania palustris]
MRRPLLCTVLATTSSVHSSYQPSSLCLMQRNTRQPPPPRVSATVASLTVRTTTIAHLVALYPLVPSLSLCHPPHSPTVSHHGGVVSPLFSLYIRRIIKWLAQRKGDNGNLPSTKEEEASTTFPAWRSPIGSDWVSPFLSTTPTQSLSYGYYLTNRGGFMPVASPTGHGDIFGFPAIEGGPWR